MTAATALSPGFAAPVAQSQAVFRALLDAMARPGRIAELSNLTLQAPPLSPAAAAVALTLADFETPVWLSPALADGFPWLRFHCGCPRAATPAEARFAFATATEIPLPLAAFDLGTDEYPDRSTTLIVETTTLAASAGLRLTGPGIETAAQLQVGGPTADFWRDREELRELFPRGLDIVLTCGARVAALPRTTRVEI
jgi:alpha-D-ribose 1-methylphosphonate 5-triphosphate synthase subunit PhnH